MEFTSVSTSEVYMDWTAESVIAGNFTPIPDYDYPIVTDPPLQELIPVSIVYGCTLILGILGNGLVIFSVSRYEQMMTITNTFLLSLASADLLLVVVCVPVKISIGSSVVPVMFHCLVLLLLRPFTGPKERKRGILNDFREKIPVSADYKIPGEHTVRNEFQEQ